MRCPRCNSVQVAVQEQPAPPVAALPKSEASTKSQHDDLHVRRDRFGIAQLLMLVAGIAVAFWVTAPLLQVGHGSNDGPIEMIPVFLRVIIAVLGGVSLVGAPLLLFLRRRARARWGPGQMAWFAQGTASWLLWPPVLANNGGWSSVCWMWGTPLMGLYVTASLIAGGRLRRRKRGWRRQWSETFGLILSCAWACTGLYLLALLYWIDVFKRD